MHVKIIGLESQAAGLFVTSSTQFGEFTARWMGEKPELGCTYHVEVEVPNIVTWEQEIRLSSEKMHFIRQEEDYILLNGELNAVEEDGVICIGLGASIFLVETEGVPSEIGNYVTCKVSEVQLFPIGR